MAEQILFYSSSTLISWSSPQIITFRVDLLLRPCCDFVKALVSLLKVTYQYSLMEVKQVELFLRQKVLDILSESLGIFFFFTVVHGLHKRAFRCCSRHWDSDLWSDCIPAIGTIKQ